MILVSAKYSDGSVEDVSRLAFLTSSNVHIAYISQSYSIQNAYVWSSGNGMVPVTASIGDKISSASFEAIYKTNAGCP
jgi:hypothetical protein